MTRFSVGEFAAACGLSPAAVRRYADADVVRPAVVDPRTGYRWYGTDQVQQGVLVRVLRELDVPLTTVRQVLATDDPAVRLALVEQHRASVERAVEAGRATRDHLARVLGGWEDLLAEFAVTVRPGQDVPVLVRRRRCSLWRFDAFVAESADQLRRRAAREGWQVCGAPVSLYTWPPDAREDRHDRVVEVALPVGAPGADDGDADAVLPGGDLVSTDAVGDQAAYPAVLAAYGAVSRWAHERGRRLLRPELVVHLAPGHVRVGWRLDDTP